MKKVLLTIICSFVLLSIHAQKQQAKVVLKNGTELVGTIISIEPSESVRISIAGIESEIKMIDVSRIEDNNQDSDSNIHAGISSEYKKTYELAIESNLERAFSERLTLVYGTLDCFFNDKNSFQVHVEFPSLKIEGEYYEQYAKGRENGWRDVFNKEIEEAVEAFISKWNKKMKGIRAKKDDGEMTMNLFITEMDLGSSAAAIWGMRTIDGGASMSGYLELLDNKSNEVISIIKINEIKGLGNNGIIFYKEGNRLKKLFEKLAIKMAEDVK